MHFSTVHMGYLTLSNMLLQEGTDMYSTLPMTECVFHLISLEIISGGTAN
jgi:hypothetical protein